MKNFFPTVNQPLSENFFTQPIYLRYLPICKYPTLKLREEVLPNREPTLVRKFFYPTHFSSAPSVFIDFD